MSEVFFNVVLESRANDGSWEEYENLQLERLGESEACGLAEIHAQRLSAHWGYIQWKRWGKRTWKIWEPGDEGVDAWVRVVPIEEED